MEQACCFQQPQYRAGEQSVAADEQTQYERKHDLTTARVQRSRYLRGHVFRPAGREYARDLRKPIEVCCIVVEISRLDTSGANRAHVHTARPQLFAQRPRKPEQTEMEYQMRNWYYFNWLCGDHICEQHIHNLDVINWLKNDYPVSANAQGGRQVRNGIDHGEIFDHFFVEYSTPTAAACTASAGTSAAP